MLKIPRKVSVILSMILSVLFFLALALAAVLAPQFVKEALQIIKDIGYLDVSASGGTLILVCFYAVILTAAAADVQLFLILVRAGSQRIFESASVALIRGVSWCCMLIAVFVLPLWQYFRSAVLISVSAAFLGLCLRVVKNVIETAVQIKSENDLTV